MMGGYGFGIMGYGMLTWVLNLIVIGLVVYFSVKMALRHEKRH